MKRQLDELKHVSLATLAGGAAIEMFDAAWAKVLENIMDVNTDSKKQRSISLKVILLPNDDRNMAKVVIEVPPPKLVSDNQVATQIFIGVDQGEIASVEHNAKQMLLFDPPADTLNLSEIREKKGENK